MPRDCLSTLVTSCFAVATLCFGALSMAGCSGPATGVRTPPTAMEPSPQPDTTDAPMTPEDDTIVAVSDPYDVYVSESPEGPWTVLGHGTGNAAFPIEQGADKGLWVRVLDRTTEVDPESWDPGVDIDAIAIRTAGGSEVFASTVHDYLVAGQPTNIDPQVALGTPDAYPDYPDMRTCKVEGFVSLGAGGQLVVFVEGKVEPGSEVVIVEVSDCEIRP